MKKNTNKIYLNINTNFILNEKFDCHRILNIDEQLIIVQSNMANSSQICRIVHLYAISLFL